MSHLGRVRYGLASVLGLAILGLLASCVSGVADPNGSGVDMSGGGTQGAAATGNVAGSIGGGQPVSTAGSTARGGGSSLGGAPAQGGGGASSQAGSTAHAGTSSQGGSTSQGGTTSQAGSNSQGGGGAQGKAGSTGMAGTTGAAGTTSTGPQPLPPITGGSSGFATRYWDCCKPACSNNKDSCGSNGTSTDGGGNQSACAGGNSFMCYSFAPFTDSANKYIGYAFAASHRACGSCWEVQFTGSAGCSEGSACPGTAAGLLYNTLYVQVLNTGSIADDQFDLLIPGGGVGEFNACSNEWGTSDLGSQYGGFLSGCNGSVSCTQTKCNTVFAGKPDLLAGCNWFLTWYAAADNPQITFKQVSCPSQLSSKSGMSG